MGYDFQRGAKTTGAKFYFNIGETAHKEWEMINEMINYHVGNGYTFIIPPYLINKTTATHAGILPRFDGDFYETTDGLLLVPTAETPMVGLHADEIFNEEDLPLKYVAVSPCFRREAGAAGKRDKGLRRVHQFHKVELFVICKPEDSEQLHQEMVEQITQFVDHLGLVYRVVELTEDDRSPVSAKTYDVEVQHGEEWLEVSSISNTENRQTKPAQIRYRDKTTKKNVKCHMLNGSGLALPRIMLALGY